MNVPFCIVLSSFSLAFHGNSCAVQTYPHDPNAFTQGLEYDRICNPRNLTSCKEVFWESTGIDCSQRHHVVFGKILHAVGEPLHSVQSKRLFFTGLYGRSTIRQVDVVTGKVVRQQTLPAKEFGEGLVKFGSRCVSIVGTRHRKVLLA